MKTTTDFAFHITRFFSQYLPHERNVSPNTVASYKKAIIDFIKYMDEKKHIPVEKLKLKHLVKENVVSFLRWLIEGRSVSPQTRNQRLAAICSFCKYLQVPAVESLEKWQAICSIPKLNQEKKAIEYLTIEGIKHLLSQPETSTRQGRRHQTLLSLMYDTGARVQEMADLTLGSLRIESKPYTVKIVGKGRKARIVPLSEQQVELLNGYLKENHYPTEPLDVPLFKNRQGRKLTREGISFIVKTYANKARMVNPGLIPERVSPHSFRHSRAMHLLQEGVNIVYLRDILGHVSIQTTEIYARADSKAKRDALEKAYRGTTPVPERIWDKDKNLLSWLQSLGK